MGPKIGSTLLVFSFFAGPVLAASEGGATTKTLSHEDIRARRVNMQLRQLAADLELTQEQQAQLKPILEGRMAEIRALRMDQSLEPQEKETRLESLHESYRSQIQSVLTSGQIQKLSELRERRRLAAQQTQTQKRKGRVPVADEE